jgi:hypothetical protein
MKLDFFKKINIKKSSIILLIILAILIIRGQIILKETKKIIEIYYAVKNNQSFDLKPIDDRIYHLVKNHKVNSELELNNQRVAYLATELYDMGGHSKCLKNLIKSLNEKYQQKVFLSQVAKSNELAKNTILEIKKYSSIEGINFNIINSNEFYTRYKNLLDMIIDFKPKTLFVFIHPDDIISTAVLSLLYKQTDIKIIFFNHSFRPNLAMNFADLIIEYNKGDELITKNERKLSNTKIINLQSIKKDETIYYSSKEILKIRQDLGIKNGNFVTMSGASSYKFFDGDDSPYFRMIKSLLLKIPNLQHVILSEFSYNEKKIIDNIFSDNKKLLERIIFVPYQAKYDIYFQSADVFIDSFPYIGPLTQIDLMRNKVATVAKDSSVRQIFSSYYQPKNYPYVFENPDDILSAVIKLLKSKKLRDEIVESNYKYWLENYENSVVRDEFVKIIEQ